MRAFMSLCLLFLVAPHLATADIIFQDDFGDGNYDGWFVRYGYWDAGTLALVHVGTEPQGQHSACIYAHAEDPEWVDYTVEYDLFPALGAGVDGDLQFRIQALEGGGLEYPRSGYRAWIRRSSIPGDQVIQLWRYFEGVGVVLAEAELPVSNHYHVVATVAEESAGTRLLFDVNGTCLDYIDADAGRPAYGGIGFRSYREQTGQAFDNVVVAGEGATPARPLSWGALKHVYR